MGHWRCSGVAGIGSSPFELCAQAASASASIGKPSFIVTGCPFVDDLLFPLDARDVGFVRSAGLLSGLLIVRDGLEVVGVFLMEQAGVVDGGVVPMVRLMDRPAKSREEEQDGSPCEVVLEAEELGNHVKNCGSK